MKKLNICKIKGCKKIMKVKKHGLCGAHWMRLMRTGDVDIKKGIRKYVKMEPFVLYKNKD